MQNYIKQLTILVLTTSSISFSSLSAGSLINLGLAGGWDDINGSDQVTTVIDQSDYTSDMSADRVSNALNSAFNTWDNVSGAVNLNFSQKSDLGGNYDVFDGVGGTLDQSSDWRYANITVGGFMGSSFFDGLGIDSSNVLAVTITGQLVNSRGKPKPEWVAEIYFNDNFLWTDDEALASTFQAFDLETVALHEIGHALGLGHEDAVGSIMASFYTGVARDLEADDIVTITDLYSNVLGGRGKGNGNGGGKGKPKNLIGTFANADYNILVPIPIPEPSTYLLLGGMMMVVAVSKKRDKKRELVVGASE